MVEHTKHTVCDITYLFWAEAPSVLDRKENKNLVKMVKICGE